MSLKINNRLMAVPRSGKWWVVGICFAVIIAGVWGYRIYTEVYNGNLKKSGMLYIPTGSTFQQVVDSLKKGDYLKDISTFQWVASKMNYPLRIQPGAYLIQEGWSNNKLIDLLRKGIQTPVKVTFNNIRFREELAAHLAHYLEPDSVAFLSALNDDKISSGLGFTHEYYSQYL
jgi:UPF0755 protein